MKREVAILLAFIKDKLSLMALFIANTALIILFFNLSLKSNEWLYPILISSVIFIPYLIVQLFSYRKLMLMLDTSETNIPEEIYTNLKYINKLNSTLIIIHKSYNNKLNEEMQKNIEFRRFISQFIHAMKTPVTVIELAIQKDKDNLYNEDKGYDVNDTIIDISKENTRQLEMLNNLLEYLRLGEFSKDYKPVSIDLLNELTQIINSKKRSFIYNNVRPNILLDIKPKEKDKENNEVTKVVNSSANNDKNYSVNDEGEVTSDEKSSSQKDKLEIFTDVKWNRIMLDQIISNAIKYSASTDKMKTIDLSIMKM
jgi:signal transduction histidine kinase